MTTDNTTPIELSPPNSYGSSTDSQDSIERAVVKVVNVLTDSHKRVVDAAVPDQIAVSENVLMTGLVYRGMQNVSAPASERLLSELKPRFDNYIAQNNSRALVTAVQDILTACVQKKEITKKQSQDILADALGHAQLDGNKKVEQHEVTGNLKDIIAKVNQNSAADEASTKSLIERLNSKETSVSDVARQKAVLDKIIASMPRIPNAQVAEKIVSLKPKEPEQPKVKETAKKGVAKDPVKPEDPKPTKETDHRDPVVDQSQLPTGPMDMVYRPESLKDGKAILMLPTKYTDEVVKVEIVDQNGGVIEQMRNSGVGDDGRRYFRAKMSGSSYSPYAKFVMYFNDGDKLELNMKADEYYVKSYVR